MEVPRSRQWCEVVSYAGKRDYGFNNNGVLFLATNAQMGSSDAMQAALQKLDTLPTLQQSFKSAFPSTNKSRHVVFGICLNTHISNQAGVQFVSDTFDDVIGNGERCFLNGDFYLSSTSAIKTCGPWPVEDTVRNHITSLSGLKEDSKWYEALQSVFELYAHKSAGHLGSFKQEVHACRLARIDQAPVIAKLAFGYGRNSPYDNLNWNIRHDTPASHVRLLKAMGFALPEVLP